MWEKDLKCELCGADWQANRFLLTCRRCTACRNARMPSRLKRRKTARKEAKLLLAERRLKKHLGRI